MNATRVLTAAVMAAILLAGCGTEQVPTSKSPTPAVTVPSDPVEYAAALMAQTNAARTAEGLNEVTASQCAQDAAQARAEALVGAPESEHAPMADVIRVCAPFTTAAENLSRAAASPAAVVEAWLESYGHRENLLSTDLVELGVACVDDSGQMLCSQVYLGS